ncbi:MAG: signal peptide peptidase SppA [Clostridiales Family XIII bacterium]|nr:signal peptide peptidase SppA [Clostridiales Family XIII bacterium]
MDEKYMNSQETEWRAGAAGLDSGASPGRAPAPPRAPGRGRQARPWRKGVFICAGIFVGIILLTALFKSVFDGTGIGGRGYSYNAYDYPYIANLDVSGTISGAPDSDLLGNVTGYYHQWTLNRIDDLINDINNRGLILYVDTPGGGVYESDELYLRIVEYKEKTGNPVYVAMGGMAASGGYYISAPADRIYANRNTWTGSIGVTLGTMFDVSEFLESHGVKTMTITSGANKSMGSNFEPVTEEQRAIFQSLVDEAYEQFIGIVAEGRDMELEDVRTIADGRIYTAKQAYELGLIDAIGSFDEALSDMQKKFRLWDCELIEMHYENNSWLGRFLNVESLKPLEELLRQGQGDLSAVLEITKENGRMPLRYMYGW